MNYIVTKPLKNTGLAVFLAILFGGIGLFYSSILGGIIMTLVFPIILILLFFLGKLLTLILLCCSYYLICLIWAVAAVNSYNKRIMLEANPKDYHSGSSGIASANFENDNYYDNYRKSQKADNTFLWLLITVIISALLFYGVYRFLNDTRLIPNSREQLKEIHRRRPASEQD
ncbi:hypothetical protein SAMN05660461_4316 [Chitinophaga ginsengisegetis]|uniref:Uncharacterized protein n=1 Tax=Chitinophaga ginsengisegetis TaxID=393003 RepID=A0A1T5P6M5_9BACT|nr:hypothetical protein [Chitinophaga ginsengisegetis]SKD08424.1 hypothetical protein SAMN05660461_4316 [Chitinophaga ginsengisegetis]